MTIDFQARLEDPLGNHLHTFSNFVDPPDGGGAGLDYVLNVGKPGALLLTVPSTIDLDLFQYDGRICPYRSIHGRGFANDNQACYFIRKRYITSDWYRITAYHANSLLERRIVAYDAGSAFADKGPQAAGDMIRAYVDENMGPSIAGSRDWITGADIVSSGLLVIEANKGDGASVSKSTSRGKMLDSMNQIADDSTTAGTYLAFNIIYGSDKIFYLITKQDQWGIDRRAGSAGQLILSPQRGNVGKWVIEEDRSDEVTVAIAGGRGQNDNRFVGTASDTRDNVSPFRYIERYFDAPNTQTQASVDAVASAFLRAYAPKVTFQSELVETPSATRGIHFDLGDIITAEAIVQRQPLRFDCRLDIIYMSVSNGHQHTRVILTSPI